MAAIVASSNALNCIISFGLSTEIAQGLSWLSKNIIYLTPDYLYIADIGSPTTSEQLALPVKAGQAQIVASPDESKYIINSGNFFGIYNNESKTITDIRTLFPTQCRIS